MKTTLNLDDALVIRAKALAARERTSLTRLIEDGLALRLRPPSSRSPRRRSLLPVYAGRGGLAPAVVDPLSNRSLLDAAEGEGQP
jgi:hypothetical protein